MIVSISNDRMWVGTYQPYVSRARTNCWKSRLLQSSKPCAMSSSFSCCCSSVRGSAVDPVSIQPNLLSSYSLTVVNEFLRLTPFLFELLGRVLGARGLAQCGRNVIHPLVCRKLLLLELREPWREELEVLPVTNVSGLALRASLNNRTYIWICFGARGILGAFSVFEGPARMVSLK